MLPIKNLFGFRKNKGLDKSIIQKNPYRNNTDLNKRQFIKKGLLGMAGLGGLALASKVAKAGGLVFNDGSTQAAGSLEGTSIKSTSETGGTKFLREDGDGSCSWQAADIIKGGDIASASPLVIDTDGSYFDVTGTVSFAAMTVAADRQFTLQFDGVLTMTHHATNLDLPSEANITTAAGDVGVFQSTGSNTVQCVSYTRADGTAVTSTPSSVGKHTLWIPAAAMRPTDSNGCEGITDVETTSGRPDLQVLDFDTGSDEHAQFQIAMPKSWNESTITFRVFWTSTATDTDGVAWGLQGVATANDDTVDVAYGTAVVVTDDNISAAEDCLVTAESSAVTIAGSPSTDELCWFRVFRDVSDANDDMAEDARLIGIQMFVTTDAGEDT